MRKRNRQIISIIAAVSLSLTQMLIPQSIGDDIVKGNAKGIESSQTKTSVDKHSVSDDVSAKKNVNGEAATLMSTDADKSADKETKNDNKQGDKTSLSKGCENKNQIYDENFVDYDRIIEESKNEDYRKIVDVAEKSFIVVRQEDGNETDIEDEKWFQMSGATGFEKITERVEKGNKAVSYKLTTDSDDVWSVVDMVNDTGDVLIAEPEYIYKTCEASVPSAEKNEGMSKEWYLKDQNIENIWSDTTTYGNTSGEGVVVAVIDTGVDYNHVDLKDNIWMNTAELLGAEGVDDDGNGYVDDIYGINMISNSSDPMDDNGHGTHVAGIIAMSNNETGGVGIAYKSQIMSIKAGGSDGSFNSSDIAKAITYAYKNGADVINMSFGSYGHSAIIEGALQDAYSSCVLVAAAGNDSYPTLDAPTMLKGNMYPAAYSYVIGVMAYDSDNKLAAFSNWDYIPNYGAEYEVTAPGKNIYSTLPGNRYASWSGTSMATPMVSAVAAILRSSYTDKSVYSSRFIMGQIVSATEDVTVFETPLSSLPYNYSKLNLAHSLTKSAKPNINVDEVYIFDSSDISDKNNGDGIVQPGETIDFAVGLRNQWGAATDAYITINATSNGGVDNPYVTFDNGNEVRIPDVGTFGRQNNGFVYSEEGTVISVSSPLRVTIAENAPNDANISFNINYHAKNGLDANDTAVYTQLIDTVYTVSVQRGTVLQGQITQDMTLTKDEYYIIQNSLLIPKGVTVNVEPGTQIQFWSNDSLSVYGDTNMAYIQVEGNMNFNGSEAAPIKLFPGKDFESYQVKVVQSDTGTVNMDYVDIINPYLQINEANHVSITQDYDIINYREYNDQGQLNKLDGQAHIEVKNMRNSKMSNIRGIYLYTYAYVHGTFDTVLFDNCQISYENIAATNCTFLDNQGRVENPWEGRITYFTSKLTGPGDEYMIPKYETVSDIYTVNGKKYVFYKFSNYTFPMYSGRDMHSYKTLKATLEANGGTIACFDVNNAEQSEILRDMFRKQDNPYMRVTSGIYYDDETQSVKYTSGEEYSSLPFGMPTKSNPFATYDVSEYSYQEDENGETVTKTGVNIGGYTSSYLEMIIAAEYPDTVSDYTVKNPNLNPVKLGLFENTKFKNNAILNRLADTDTTNWMKVAAQQDNKYIYICTDNYWGTTDKTLIQKQLIDFDTNIRFGDIVSDPYLSEPASSTYPCVSDIYLVDKNGEKVRNVGNGECEVHVLFNRDMDTSVLPVVTYGPDDPYTDYVVEGAFVNAREWVGKATIKVLINQGRQLFKVKGAVAADDKWLVTGNDWGRFEFNIEATGAEALVLQSEGTEGSVYLNWTQDDYETLAGYNVYRSLSGAEGTFAKINKTIIDASTKEFTDTTVDCGKVYSYYFTVVETDMKESRPSNIVKCASIDNEPPKIVLPSDTSITYGMNSTITATITDNIGVNAAFLYYRMNGEENYNVANMTCSNGNVYAVQIPSKNIKVGVMEYYVEAADSVSSGYMGTASEPCTCIVDSKSKITSVSCEGGKVGEIITATINGVNFDETTQVYIDNQKVKQTLVSDKEINIEYTPQYMGKKNVSLCQDSETVATFNNAFDVTDDSIYITNDDAIVIKGVNCQNVYFSTNYVGKISSLEVTYEKKVLDDGMVQQVTVYTTLGCMSNNWDINDGDTIYKAKLSNTSINKGNIMYISLENTSVETLPSIKDVKINGVSVKNINVDMDKIKFIDESQYVPVDKVTIECDATTYEIGDIIRPVVKVEPANATRKDSVQLNYDTSRFMKNEDGTLTAIASGNSYLSANVDNVVSIQGIDIYINPKPITEIIPVKSSYTGIVGQSITVEVTTDPSDSDANISWGGNYWEYMELATSSDNGRKATFKLKKVGNVMIDAMYNDIRRSISIEILPNEAYTQIDEEIVTLCPNQNYQLNTRIVNQQSEAISMKYKSSNTSVATVSEDGIIMAVSNGYAVITASIDGGVSSDFMILLVGTDSMSYKAGDVNMDGNITSTDALLALKLSLGGQCNSVFTKIIDVNGDGTVTSADSMLILQYVTGVINSFDKK